MREWTLTPGSPLSLTLAADARLCNPDFTNDHIWELTLGTGEPAAVAVETTYGLRARQMRLFPRFSQSNTTVDEVERFHQMPVVQQFCTNYARLLFSPFSGIDVISEYWVPGSNSLSGRIRITNSSVIPRQIKFEWAAHLSPLGNGRPMAAELVQVSQILSGITSGLCPVLFMTGGPEPGTGPFPSLAFDLDLAPGGFRQLTWALASLDSLEKSFEEARRLTARPWEVELARIEMMNDHNLVEIETGDPDWDAVLAFSQKNAVSLLMPGSAFLPHESFVLSRQPDNGYSFREDGSDYSGLWGGQTAIDAYYLAGFLLPGAPELAKGILRNFLAAQNEDGFIDWKLGLGGQKGKFQAAPLLATLAWKIWTVCEDRAFLEEVFPKLVKFIEHWFSDDRDRDQDGFPEWDHPYQTGFEDNPAFSLWNANAGQLPDIRVVESPALGAFLLKEISSLEKIAKILGKNPRVSTLKRHAGPLKKAVAACWDTRRGSYRNRDRDTHLSNPGQLLCESAAEPDLLINKTLSHPSRLVVRIQFADSITRPIQIVMHGRNSKGSLVEEIPPRSMTWIEKTATATSTNAFVEVSHVEVHGLFEKDQVSIRTADFLQDDITLLLPLWAGAPGTKQVESMVKKSIRQEKRFDRAYGMPACAFSSRSAGKTANFVSFAWNQLVIEGLLAYEQRDEAARLVGKMMTAAVQSLKINRAFYRGYDADTGDPTGERNMLQGFIPVGLFLETLGVQILSPWRVAINGANPFPWPVKIRFRGLVIDRQLKQTNVTFPDGQTAAVGGSGSHLVSLV